MSLGLIATISIILAVHTLSHFAHRLQSISFPRLTLKATAVCRLPKLVRLAAVSIPCPFSWLAPPAWTKTWLSVRDAED